MRHAKLVGISILAMTVVSAPGFARGADTSGKVEQKAEAAKEKTKSTTQEAKSAVSDSWLTAKTKIALFGDDRVKGSQIKVETTHGVVALQGKVDSPEAKGAATEIARGIDGVKEVKNELQVVSPSQRKAVDANDKEITRHVQDRLSKDARLKNAKIDVRTDKGVVTLTGEVPSISLSARASELAREVPGVRSVRNDLAYEPRTGSARTR
jgi:hyperosmotically inducible periplasmic protein